MMTRGVRVFLVCMSTLMSVATGCASVAATLAPHRGGGAGKSLRMPDGQPNLQGVWTNVTLTPFERSEKLVNKAFYSAAEFATAEAEAERRMEGIYRPPEGVGTDNDAFFDKDRHLLATHQTSLVIDPPNGRVPLRPDMLARSDARSFSLDSFETMAPMERCISLGSTILFPKFINNGYHIVQTPHNVLIYSEMMSDARTIPLDNSAHVDPRIRSWSGDSRGHWEGDTLVVDTTNFNSLGRIATSVSQIAPRSFPQTKTLHTVECFKLVDSNTIEYQITFDDPAVFTRPWTVSFPFTRASNYKIFEFACHEGNYSMEAMLRGARVQEDRSH